VQLVVIDVVGGVARRLGTGFTTEQPEQRDHHRAEDGEECDQMSRFFTNFAFSSMNLRRGSTSSPISVSNSPDASSASSMVTLSSVRLGGSIVVSRSWSGFISPSPL